VGQNIEPIGPQKPSSHNSQPVRAGPRPLEKKLKEKQTSTCVYWLLSFWTSAWIFQILVWVEKTRVMYF